jgi:cytochrome c2
MTNRRRTSTDGWNYGVKKFSELWWRVAVNFLLAALAASPILAMDGAYGGGDPDSGRTVIERSGCLSCHSIKGNGNGEAGDLAFRSISHRQSPAETAAEMWNHAPDMWDSVRTGGDLDSVVTPAEAEDVFAYFRSARYFDLRGEVIRGKRVFSEKGCASCHQLESGESPASAGPPVDQWKTLFDTAGWTSSLWNHAGSMLELMERSKTAWPLFTEQEMVDLLLYLRTSVELERPIHELIASDATSGRAVFVDRGCVDCHTLGESASGKVNLENTARDARSMSGLASAMWNHIPQMYGKKAESNGHLDSLTPSQVASLASYFYTEGAFSEKGNADKGKMVFSKKECDTCHLDGASALEPANGKRFNAPSMMSAVWSHGPSMLDEMSDRGVDWPEFSEKEMEDLISFLNDGRSLRVAEQPIKSEKHLTEQMGR